MRPRPLVVQHNFNINVPERTSRPHAGCIDAVTKRAVDVVVVDVRQLLTEEGVVLFEEADMFWVNAGDDYVGEAASG